MFIENKYYKWYYMIINHRITNPIDSNAYGEKHHIIPKSLGGNNTKSNIVKLLPREHYVCHLMLLKMTSGRNKVKMSYAIRMMSIVENELQHRYKISSHMYDMIINMTSTCIGQHVSGNKNHFYGKTHSDESKMKMKAKRALQPPAMLGKMHSDETKQKIKDATHRQFSNELNRDVQRQKSLEQFEDPIQRYKAGNGKRGKKWYHDPITLHIVLCFEQDKPIGYITGTGKKGIIRGPRGSIGKKWYYNPETQHTIMCAEQDKPTGYIPGRHI